jgi:hypothetical protein
MYVRIYVHSQHPLGLGQAVDKFTRVNISVISYSSVTQLST